MKIDTMTFPQLVMNDDADFIPLLSSDEEEKMMNEKFNEILPLLTVKNTVLFPGVVIPITAGRDKSIKLLQEAQQNDRIIAVLTQKDNKQEDPKSIEELHSVGTVARILKLLKMPDGSTTVILQGVRRFQCIEIIETEPYLKCKVKLLKEAKPKKDLQEFEGIIENIRTVSTQIIQNNPTIPSEAVFAINNIEGDNFLVNFVSSNMNLSVEEKQSLLEIDDLRERALQALRFLNIEQQKLEIRNDIQSKVRHDIDQQQREYFLNQQIRTIQEELGGISFEQEIEDMRIKGESKKWNKETQQHFDRELKRLQRMNPQSPEHGIQRNYLELYLELPWNEFTKDKFDLKRAEKILNRDHFGLEDVKKRILEYLAVLKVKGDMKSPIICLYGPPGVGKTSLGKSVAESLGRKYIRISLGGVHDESEIRGHRKTYIGAMPGRIIQSIKKAESANPVFVLDEIDKLGTSMHGDPSSALLEVLDPEQNTTFYDNFLEQGFDLSKVLFIATANSLSSIQPALLDRMEIIEISGYTIEEKVEIAVRHLINKQLSEHGLQKDSVQFGKKEIQYLIQSYTRESGVRNLEKKIAKIIRHYTLLVAKEESFSPKVSTEKMQEILGAPRSIDLYEKSKVPGVVTGLAWTRVGGDILFIESLLSKGNGKLSMTGNLGNVMKESATIALEYIKANYDKFSIKPEMFSDYNIHVHVPEGATPKDGPSAGITMLTSFVSSFTGKKVKPKLAMTGEITLRGKVLPVGGIKEKILAAKRAGITEVILCDENEKDIKEINQNYLKGLKIHYVKEMQEVIQIAL